MTGYQKSLIQFFLLLFVCLASFPVYAINPFTTKDSLNISETGSAKSADSAGKRADIKAEARDAKSVTLAVMADLHARPESLPMLEKAIARVNSLKDIYALAITGDLCSKLGTGYEYEVLHRGLKGLKVPAYAVPGNHDILYKDNLVNGEKKRGTPAEKRAKQEAFKKTLNLKSLYYSRKAGGHLLVFLPNDALSAIPCSMPSDETLEFLRETLRKNRDLPTIIFSHAPLAGSYGDKKTMPPLQANAQPAGKLQRILRANPQVYLWFAGHLHITPAQKYFNFAGNKVGKVTVIHVPPIQIHSAWFHAVSLSSKGAVIRTMDVRTGRYLKKHTRVFRPATAGKADDQKPENVDQNDIQGLKKARIIIVNAHAGGNRDRDGFGKWLDNQDPDLALVSESVNMAPHLREAGRFLNAGNESKGQQEVSVVVRHGLAVSSHDQGKISPDLGIGIAHDRWWKRVQTRVAGLKTRVYSLHLNAVIQQKSGEPMASNRWDVTREGLTRLEKQWRDDIKDGWAVIIGGDLNWCDARANARSHNMAPGRIFKRLGLSYVNKELMWLAWTPRTHEAVKRYYMSPADIPGLFAGEHPALRIELKARKKADDKDRDQDQDKEEENQSTSIEEPDHDSDEPEAEESELEPENDSETVSDDELIDATPTVSDDKPESEISPTDDNLEEIDEVTGSDNDSETSANETVGDESNAGSEEAGLTGSDASDEEAEAAAIERIRELIAEVYERLLNLFSAFTSLLRT